MPTNIADIVDTWFAQRLACGPVAHNTEAYNQVTAALPDLIAALSPAAAPAPAAPVTALTDAATTTSDAPAPAAKPGAKA